MPVPVRESAGGTALVHALVATALGPTPRRLEPAVGRAGGALRATAG
jgi:hypothetical protein